MTMTSCSRAWCWIVLGASLAGTVRAQITSYGVTKTGYYVQNSDAAPVLDSGENHYFEAFVSPDGTVDLDSAVLRTPSNLQMDLAPIFYYFQGFTTQAALDNQFGNGTYSFQISTVDLDVFFAQLSLSGTFPNPPRVSNFAACQSVNAGADFTLRWDAFTGGTTGDGIWVTIEDDTGSTVFQTGSPGAPGGLTGVDTSVVIPAQTLAAGTNYDCYLSFNRVTTLDGSSIPGALGIAAYVRETRMPLKTAAGAGVTVNLAGYSRAPDGSFRVDVSGTPGATFTLEATTDFSSWSTLITTNATSGTFSYTDSPAPGVSERFYRAKAN